MKLHHESDEIIGTSLDDATQFNIKASPKTFMVLSKNIYSRCERAIIRELSTNATDSHSEAGNLDTPFKIQIPTMLDPRFICRDYGTGLSPKATMDLMTTYFASTKDQTNEYIGALGLGSKSPFSYTDTFNIVSYYKGTAYGFTAFLHNGLPKCLPTFEEPTDEENGLEITVPVNPDDVTTWHNEAKYILRHFTNHKPVINHIEIDYFPKFDDYLINPAVSDACGVYAIMGNIQYPIPREFYENTWLDTLNRAYIKFEIGELDIMPSREEIHLSNETKANLKKRIDEVNKSIVDGIADKIRELKTERMVAKFIDDLQYDQQEIIVAMGTVGDWNVKEITDKFYEMRSNEPRVIGGAVYKLNEIRYVPKKLKNMYCQSIYRLYPRIRLCVSHFTCVIDDVNKSKARIEFLDGIQELPDFNLGSLVMFKADVKADMDTLEYIKQYFDESEMTVYKISECDDIRKLANQSQKQISRKNSRTPKEKPEFRPNVSKYTLEGDRWVCREANRLTAKEIRGLTGYFVYNSNGDYIDDNKSCVSNRLLKDAIKFVGITEYYSITTASRKYVEESQLVDVVNVVRESMHKIVKKTHPNKIGHSFLSSSQYAWLEVDYIKENIPNFYAKIVGKNVDQHLTETFSSMYYILNKETRDLIREKFLLASKRIDTNVKNFQDKNPLLASVLLNGRSLLKDKDVAQDFEKYAK